MEEHGERQHALVRHPREPLLLESCPPGTRERERRLAELLPVGRAVSSGHDPDQTGSTRTQVLPPQLEQQPLLVAARTDGGGVQAQDQVRGAAQVTRRIERVPGLKPQVRKARFAGQAAPEGKEPWIAPQADCLQFAVANSAKQVPQVGCGAGGQIEDMGGEPEALAVGQQAASKGHGFLGDRSESAPMWRL